MKEIREKIDAIDEKIVKLLDDRARLVRQIGKAKDAKGAPVLVPHREQEVIEHILSAGSGSEDGFPAGTKVNIFREILAGSRLLQRPITVSYFGAEATYTHMAAVRYFSDQCEFIPLSTISKVFREVEKGRADYGVVPIENSTEGIVSHTLDMFIESNCVICAELLMDISHNLLSRETGLDRIERVFSHPQALAQCRGWLEENLPEADYLEAASTAHAAEKAVSQKGTAAIASPVAARVYGLNVLAEKIEDISENVTRFLVIGDKVPGPSEKDKTTVMFSVKDRVGILHDVLVPFKTHSVNLTKIESRPSRTKAWEYVFFVDFEGHSSSANVMKALRELEEECVFLKVLGSYPAASLLTEKKK